jgi:hypothetical protein
MEKIKKAEFEEWVKGCNWLRINEVGTPNGQQDTYLTPAGEFAIAQYNLSGELQQIVKPMPAPPQASRMGRFPLDFRGGGQFPSGSPGQP